MSAFYFIALFNHNGRWVFGIILNRLVDAAMGVEFQINFALGTVGAGAFAGQAGFIAA
ncbi:MAG: hypothetical protein ACON4V_00800 [Parvibaculales bacterium]